MAGNFVANPRRSRAADARLQFTPDRRNRYVAGPACGGQLLL